jgi:hypothetical protein
MRKDYFASNYCGMERGEERLCKIVKKHFLALVGAEVDYYGADEGDNTFMVDCVVFKAVEDPDDGYRSYLGTINYTEDHNSIFFRTPIARVRIETFDKELDHENPEKLGDYHGYRFIDVVDDHVWLEFGTRDYSDYYPYFVFRHRPKKG